jgi:integrase
MGGDIPFVVQPRTDDAGDVSKADSDQYRALIYLAVDAGMRWGELVGLRRSAVDVRRGKVRDTEQLVQLRTREFVRRPPKTSAGIRSITISPFTADRLQLAPRARCQPRDERGESRNVVDHQPQQRQANADNVAPALDADSRRFRRPSAVAGLPAGFAMSRSGRFHPRGRLACADPDLPTGGSGPHSLRAGDPRVSPAPNSPLSNPPSRPEAL